MAKTPKNSARTLGVIRGWETRRRNDERDRKKISRIIQDHKRLQQWMALIADCDDPGASEMASSALLGHPIPKTNAVAVEDVREESAHGGDSAPRSVQKDCLF